MPGISVMYQKNFDQSLLSESLSDLKHEQNYKVQQLFLNNNLMLAFSGYEGYPRQHFEDDKTAFLLEGLIYNKTDSQVKRLLQAISKTYIERNDYKNWIKGFIDDSDGDFIVSIYFKQLGELIIFNDRWGRLPSYYYYDDDMFIFSRELSFILKFIPSIQFDKVSMAELLSFAYTLGDRTLIKNIHRVSPSCIFNLKPSDAALKISVEKVFDVNLEESPRTLSKSECIERCKDLFLQSTNYRISKMREKKYHITADLSGGYDTRAVLGGLCKFNAEVDYVTDCLITGDESEYAEKVAALYNKKPIRMIASHDMSYSDISKITYITDCTVNVLTALSCYYDSLERIKQAKDMSVRFMGLGGEFIRCPYKERGRYKTLIDMVKDDYFVRYIEIKQACSIVNLDEETFYNHLTAYFNEYPEPTLRDKVKHFYFEYYNNLVNAGENRHRLHFWTVQPLWSKDLFSFEMKSIPAKYIDYDFFIGFMRAIDPVLLDAPFHGHNARLNSKMTLYKAALISKPRDILVSHRRLRRFIIKILNLILNLKIRVTHNDACGSIKRDLWRNYTNLNILSLCLDEKNMHKFIKNEHSDLHLYLLMSLLVYFKEIENRYTDKINLRNDS